MSWPQILANFHASKIRLFLNHEFWVTFFPLKSKAWDFLDPFCAVNQDTSNDYDMLKNVP